MPDRKLLAVYGGVFFTAMSILLFQISLTRVFAVIMWHHFAPVLVSLALLGFGASGSMLTARRESDRDDDPAPRMARHASLYGLMVFLSFCWVTLIRVDTLQIKDPVNILALLFCYVVISVPFFFGGLALGIALTRYPQHVGKIYFVDLLGSGIGAFGAVWLLQRYGSTPSVMVASALGLLGGAAFALGAGFFRLLLHGLGVAFGVVLVIGFCLGGWREIPGMSWKLHFPPEKDRLYYEQTIPSVVAQVDVTPPMKGSMAIGGHFGDVDWQENVPMRGVAQDGTAPSSMYEHATDLDRFPSLDDTQAASAYIALEARGGKEPEVMVIGVGGGVDVMVALRFGSPRVQAVELNEAMVRMVTETYADYIDHLFDDPRVSLVNEEGRAFARHNDEPYDIIQMSGVDTYTALAMGAFTLGESYLYTVEAVKDFYARLKPDGYINYSRRLMTYPRRPRETIRLANTVRAALEELGVEDPAGHVCILQAHGWASTMIKKDSPFTKAEIERLRQWAKDEHFMGLAFDPLRKRDGAFEPGRLNDLSYEPPAAAIVDYAMRYVPADQRPALREAAVKLYVDALRAGADGDKAGSDALIAKMAAAVPKDKAAAFAEELRIRRDEAVVTGQKTHFAHFEGIQKALYTVLRAPPPEREAYVRDYIYDITPCTDDKPFFFDYFRFSKLLDTLGGEVEEAWLPDFPVGHTVLVISIIQIVILAFILIILPVLRLKREGVRSPHRFRVFLYFSSLGVGFMFVEIGLMQKLVLYLGNPVYSLSVVLGGILVASGLGALSTTRIERADRRTLNRVLLWIVLLIGMNAAAVNWLLPPLLGLPIAARIAVALALVTPTGFMLGRAFPLGIRILEARSPVLIPWGWAINGFLSVLSSLLTIVAAMSLGFTWVLAIAAGVYVVGFLAMVEEPEKAAA